VTAILRPVTPPLETERLVLRPLQLTDAVQVQELFPTWEIVRYLRDVVPWPFPNDGVFRYYRDTALPGVQRGEQWVWTLRLKRKPEQIIGSIDLHRSDEDNRGFWLGLPWQGEGLMTEAVEAVTDFWFAELGFDVLRSPKAACNEASRRISMKTGMRLSHTGTQAYVSGVLPAEWWEITREMWLQHRADRRHLQRKS